MSRVNDKEKTNGIKTFSPFFKKDPNFTILKFRRNKMLKISLSISYFQSLNVVKSAIKCGNNGVEYNFCNQSNVF